MATRYYSLLVSEHRHTPYLIAINDSSFAGTAEVCTVRSASLAYEGQGNERTQRILGTSGTVELIINSTALETLLEDIAGSPEGRFTLSIVDVTSSGYFSKFIGYILPDLISIPDESYKANYTIQLKATDGLSRLKTISYNDGGDPYEGYNTILEHIFNCLNMLPAITGAYGNTEDFLKIVFNWYEDSRAYDGADNTFTKVRNNHVAYYTIDSKGNYNYKSCYEVLEEICKTFFCRMFFANGTFWIISLDELRLIGLNAKTVFIYNKLQGESTDTVDFRILNDNADLPSTGLVRLDGGEYGFFPPLKKTAVRYSHRSTVNMLAGKVVSNTGGGGITYSTVDYYNGDGKLYFTSSQRYKLVSAFGDTPPFVFSWSITLRVGTYYLVTDNSGANLQWTTTPGFYKRNLLVSSVGTEFILTFSIGPTPNLIESGDLYFDISFSSFSVITGAPTTGVTAEWTFENLQMELLAVGAFSGQADIKEYSAVNDDGDNSATVEVDTILGDGPGLTSPGHLMVLNTDDFTWSLTDAWRRADTGTYKTIAQLLANKMIEGQLLPVKKFIGTFQNWNQTYEAWQVIDIIGTYWAFNGGSFDLKRDRVSGEWFNFPYVPGIDYVEGAVIDRPNGANGGSGSSSSSTSGSGGSGGSTGSSSPARLFIIEFENVTTSITITNDLFIWDYNGSMVFWNGRPLKQSDYSFNEPDIDWNFPDGIKGTTNHVSVVSIIQ